MSNNGELTYVSTEEELTEVEQAESEDYELIPLSQAGYRSVSELAKLLPESMQEGYRITKRAARKLATRLRSLTHGGTVEIPMMCSGPSCPMAGGCPLLEEGVAPIGQVCPIEKYMAESIRAYYIKDLDINVNNFVDMTQINDLVECEILDQRMTSYLTKDGWFEDVVVGVSKDGNPIFRKEEAVGLKIKMRMKARKDKLLRSFLATPEMKAKYKVGVHKDPSSYAADIIEAGERFKDEVEEAEVEAGEDG